jgi:hypothetical protein
MLMSKNVPRYLYNVFVDKNGKISQIKPRDFNDNFPNGIIFLFEQRGTKYNKNLHLHPQRGIALKNNKVVSVLISMNQYPEIDRIKFPYIDLNKQKFKRLIDWEFEKMPDGEFSPEESTIAIYSGCTDYNSKDNKTLIKHAGTKHPIRLFIYFGPEESIMWFIGYVRCTKHEETTINGDPRHVFYFSLI